MTYKNIRVVLLYFVILIPFSSIADNNDLSSMERAGAEKKMLLMKEILQKRDVAISFYGKVTDQDGAPVIDASVKIHVLHFSPNAAEFFGAMKIIVVQTDNTGTFSVEQEKGQSLYIQSISKAGYDGTILTDQNCSFQYFEENGHQKPFVADKKAPVVFRMRKQGDVSFLLYAIGWNCKISASESGQSKGYDLIRREHVRDMTKLILNDEPLVCDFQINATFNTNDATWVAILSPGNTNGGIIVSEKLFYEAPESGYQQKYLFMPQDRKPVEAKYVYLKSRNPAIYSRLEIEYLSATDKSFRIEGKSVTNPYGDRNLEQADDLPYEVSKQLTDEAKAAIRQNKRPEKPDLPKLIKEAKDKASKNETKP